MGKTAIMVRRLATDDGQRATWQATLGDAVVASASVGRGSGVRDRFLRLEVEPEHRRAGIGSTLLRTVAEDLARERCEVLSTIAVVGSEGEAFAARHGAEIGDELVDDVLNLEQLDLMTLHKLAAAVPPGYTSTQWQGRVPDHLVGSYAHAKRFIADAPNLFPPAVPEWDAALVREWESSRAAAGDQLWVGVLVVEDTTRIAAFSEISVDASPKASQEDTAVLPQHRRHGLATCVKADLILRVREARPDLRTLTVTCAATNTGMRTVNHRLGFREWRRRNLVRLPIHRLL